jgi:hypothetical protein
MRTDNNDLSLMRSIYERSAKNVSKVKDVIKAIRQYSKVCKSKPLRKGKKIAVHVAEMTFWRNLHVTRNRAKK